MASKIVTGTVTDITDIASDRGAAFDRKLFTLVEDDGTSTLVYAIPRVAPTAGQKIRAKLWQNATADADSPWTLKALGESDNVFEIAD